MYELTGMTMEERDEIIYNLWRRGVTYRVIARRVGCSTGAVQASLRRTGQRMRGLRE
jgi:DNA-directed RNA polymerase specialized sigma24 family protein